MGLSQYLREVATVAIRPAGLISRFVYWGLLGLLAIFGGVIDIWIQLSAVAIFVVVFCWRFVLASYSRFNGLDSKLRTESDKLTQKARLGELLVECDGIAKYVRQHGHLGISKVQIVPMIDAFTAKARPIIEEISGAHAVAQFDSSVGIDLSKFDATGPQGGLNPNKFYRRVSAYGECLRVLMEKV